MDLSRARKAIRVARSHLERVRVAWIAPADPEEAVLFAFYAYENAIVALAEAKGMP